MKGLSQDHKASCWQTRVDFLNSSGESVNILKATLIAVTPQVSDNINKIVQAWKDRASELFSVELPGYHWCCPTILSQSRGATDAFSKTVVPNLLGTRDWFRGRQFFHERGWGMAQAVMLAMGSGRGSSTRLPLTSCCAARFLTGGWGSLF